MSRAKPRLLPASVRSRQTAPGCRLRPRLETLESRQLLAAATFVNDDWALATDNAPAGVSLGDIVRNDHDAVEAGTVSATYGTNGFGTVQTLSEDWDDGNDTGPAPKVWTRYQPLAAFGAGGTYSFPGSSQGGLGYRIQAPGSPDPGQLGPQRLGSTISAGTSDNFVVSMDIVDWNPELDHSFGFLLHLGSISIGQTTGYAVSLTTDDGDLVINRIVGEAPTPISAEFDGTLSVTTDYRLVAFTQGSQITALLYDLNNPFTPLGVVTANDSTYRSDIVGMYTYDNSSGGSGSVDTTFDNYRVSVKLPGASAINEAIASTDPGGPVTLLDGSYAENVNVNANVVLKGTATIGGRIDVTSPQGVVSPGGSPGLMIASDLAMTAGSKLKIELDGPVAGGEHDQMIIFGSVDVAGAVLDATLGYAPTVGEQFVIVANEDFDSVAGTFDGLDEGEHFNIGATLFTITYQGGDGNDIMLTAEAAVPSVVGRHVYYNNSAWDGNSSVANAADDAAIATDKSPLLPGGTGSLANYTSFSKGITGIMVDVMSPPGTITAGDFTFKTGNSNNTAAWTPLATAPTVSLRPGAGSSTRVSLTWPDDTIKKTWLQVTLHATAATGLAANDVFYFGNAVGEAGDTTANALVNATDEIQARANPRNIVNPAPITFLYDYNRDKLVNATDQIVARSNVTNVVTALRLIVPTPAAGPLARALADAAMANGVDEAVDRLARRRLR